MQTFLDREVERAASGGAAGGAASGTGVTTAPEAGVDGGVSGTVVSASGAGGAGTAASAAGTATSAAGTATSAAGTGGAAPARWDVALLDPPYDLDEESLTANLTALLPLLAPDAIVLVERSSRSPEPTLPAGLRPIRNRSYGETVLWWSEPDSD
ncbi:RsmD family RNA methyltransferase [Leucobacter albus]|uniref:RsmD family RNA methyltransferase n=1 Tax=Leucobacter albus TaxID=272210 RepID=UPI003639E722